jgi:glutamate synthase (NADPH/NADH) small chain
MGEVKGFLEFTREVPERRPAADRIADWNEFSLPFPEEKVRKQGARCMDCGVPFCHSGCPLNNLIPDWNDLVYRNRWKDAIRQLHATNNFPEFTGRVCPAPCEASCVLGINDLPVTIKQIERMIIYRAFAEGWIKPEMPAVHTGKRIAVVGSGPSGLAAAQQLARAGHRVTVLEKNDRIGGLLRYGIPNFKMEKHLIDRRVEQMRLEGVEFTVNMHVGGSLSAEDLRKEYDAVLLTIGAEQPRDLPVPGRQLKGIHFAMEFLPQQNRRCEGDAPLDHSEILATGKRVVIIGGGDTGADCLGTCHRQRAASVTQFELMPRPPETRSPDTPWPLWPLQLRTESSHEEGGSRKWSVATAKFTGDSKGRVTTLHTVRVGPPPRFEPVPGSESTIEADLVLLAMGFLGPVRKGLVEQLNLELDQRGNVTTDGNYMTPVPSVFAAGDARRGQSLVVWAIAEGRKAARGIDIFLMGKSSLP